MAYLAWAAAWRSVSCRFYRSKWKNPGGLHGSAEKTHLLNLGERGRCTFTELKAEEDDLHKLISHLHSHLQEALAPLLQPDTATYGENGIAEGQRPRSVLLRSRA